MRTKIIAFLLCLPGFAGAQTQQDSLPPGIDTHATPVAIQHAQQYLDSLHQRDLNRMEDNLDSFLREQKRQKEKKKTQALISLGLGLFFLAVLVIGWRRKSKKKG